MGESKLISKAQTEKWNHFKIKCFSKKDADKLHDLILSLLIGNRVLDTPLSQDDKRTVYMWTKPPKPKSDERLEAHLSHIQNIAEHIKKKHSK